MLIAIDYDETYTRDPEFWRVVFAAAKHRGHSVIGVTWRKENECRDMCAHYLNLDRVYFTGGASKKRFVESTYGRPVDVWIDDTPHSIIQDFPSLEWPAA